MEQVACDPHLRSAQVSYWVFWHPVYGLPEYPGSQTHLFGVPYSQWLFGPQPGEQIGGPTGGIQNKLGSPMKPCPQIHWPVSLSHLAFKPQVFPWQASRQRPESQICPRWAHGFLNEHTTGEHTPPGNGFPIMPSRQTQTGPWFDTIHWAFCPHLTPRHWEVHFPSEFSL